MRFRDIIGQEGVKQQLRLSVQDQRIAHARLLAGKEGVGKLPLAIAYAQYINCPNRTAEDSCGVCPACLQFGQLQHPDLHFAFPIVKGDRGDTCNDFMDKFREIVLEKQYFSLDDWYRKLEVETKQGMIYEKESQEMLRKLSLKPFGNGYKVMIIWQPEKMNAVCANKLLKLLEEPPEKTLFLLVSEHPDQLLPTILSRVQLTRVPDLTEAELSEHVSADIAHIAMGSYLTAIRLQQNDEQRQMFMTDFIALMRHAWMVGHARKYDSLLEMRRFSLEIADAKVGREKQKAFLQYAQQQVRENYIRRFSQPQMNYQTAEEAAFSEKFCPYINEGNVEQIMRELEKAEQQISQNGNAKIIFFDLCLQLIVLIKK